MKQYYIITMYDILATETTFGDLLVVIRQLDGCIFTIIVLSRFLCVIILSIQYHALLYYHCYPHKNIYKRIILSCQIECPYPRLHWVEYIFKRIGGLWVNCIKFHKHGFVLYKSVATTPYEKHELSNNQEYKIHIAWYFDELKLSRICKCNIVTADGIVAH